VTRGIALAEFAAMEIGLAVRASKHSVQQMMSMTRRLQAETPDAWDAWQAGDINHAKAIRINRAVRRLVRDESKRMLKHDGRRRGGVQDSGAAGSLAEPIHRKGRARADRRTTAPAIQDRYVSVRPDVDGISFLSAAMSALDATAVDQVLTTLAAAADRDDPRTQQQRRADALVDVLLGRVSNGRHVKWLSDNDNDNDDESDGGDEDFEDLDDHGDDDKFMDGVEFGGTSGWPTPGTQLPDVGATDASDAKGNVDDWDLPASAFRPDPPRGPNGTVTIAPASGAVPRTTPCPGAGTAQARPVQVSIGIIVSAPSLFGYTNSPGQLVDRSAPVLADSIRDLAAQPGTLFHRLLTDERGNLLDVTELGRFPSRKLGLAISYRDGACTNPSCTVPAAHCDLDHLIPVPEGPTTGANLDAKCRTDHLAKTHAGHRSTRTGPHTTAWTTPSGHTYHTDDERLPVEAFPDPP